jgi:hypothetical protein
MLASFREAKENKRSDLLEAAGDHYQDAQAIDHRDVVSEIQCPENDEKHLLDICGYTQRQRRRDFVRNETGDIERERQDARQDHHLRRGTGEQWTNLRPYFGNFTYE